MTRDDIVACARSYLGVRWQHQGRDRKGVDCVGLLHCVAHDLGIETEDDLTYRRTPDPHRLKTMIYRQTTEADRNQLCGGQIMMVKQAYFPCHLQITAWDTKEPTVIHASILKRKVIEEPLKLYWPELVSLRNFPGVV